MGHRNESTIRDYITSRNLELKNAESLTSTGKKTSRLLNEDQILEVAAKYKPELLQAFAKLGLRASLHQLAGYSVSSTAVESKSEIPAVNPKDAFILEVIKVGLQAGFFFNRGQLKGNRHRVTVHTAQSVFYSLLVCDCTYPS